MSEIVVSRQEDRLVTAAEVTADQWDLKIEVAPTAIEIEIIEMSIHNTVTFWTSCGLYFVDHKDKWHYLEDKVHTPTNKCIFRGALTVKAKSLGFFMTRGLVSGDTIRISYTYKEKRR